MSTHATDDLVHEYQKAIRDLQHARARQTRRRNAVLRARRRFKDQLRELRVECAGLRERVKYLESGLRQIRDNYEATLTKGGES